MTIGGNYGRRSLLRKVAATSVATGAIGTSNASEGSETGGEEVYVVLAGGSSLRNHLERIGYEMLHELAAGSVYIVRGPETEESDLRSIPVVSDAIPNQTFVLESTEPQSDDSATAEESPYEEQWYMELTRAFDAHTVATGEGTSIAVIDTGVDHTHPDLEPQLDVERSRLFRNGTIYSGTDRINVPTAPEPVEEFVATDVDGHGSHVAGIAAAPRNETGIVGVAPDATIVSLRPFFFEDPLDGIFDLMGTFADMLVAIDYAVEIGVDVVNISVTVGDPDPGSVSRRRMFAALNRVVTYAIERGTTVVAATGNDGIDTDEFPGYVLPPSTPGTIGVGAVGPTDKRSHYSNFGDSTVDVAAPGGGYETEDKTYSIDSSEVEYPYPTNYILSSVPEALYGMQYEYFPGTSAAAPQVAGMVCLLRELAPQLHPRMIKQVIQQGTVELTGDGTSGLGAGRVDVPNTINALIETGMLR